MNIFMMPRIQSVFAIISWRGEVQMCLDVRDIQVRELHEANLVIVEKCDGRLVAWKDRYFERETLTREEALRRMEYHVKAVKNRPQL